VEEQKRKAEQDKMVAITELEKKSREFLVEKQAKRALEERIAGMQSQMLTGGQKIEDTPAFRSLLMAEHKRIRNEYESKLQELEAERQGVEEDKTQVGRYKAVLLKQRVGARPFRVFTDPLEARGWLMTFRASPAEPGAARPTAQGARIDR
jgi:kinesin family protein 3/17